MKRLYAFRMTLGASALLLVACATDRPPPNTDSWAPVEVVRGDDSTYTVVYPVTGFKRALLDDDYQCRVWAYGRDGRAVRPCAGEVPSCGDPIPFSEVTVVTSEASAKSSVLVTRGTYRAAIEQTAPDTQRRLAARIAREGCDLLVVDGEEWISLGRGNNFRYLQVRWGSKDPGRVTGDQAAP